MASLAELPAAQDLNTQGNAVVPPRARMDYKSMLKSFMFRIILIYVVSTFFKKRDTNISQTNNNSTMGPACKSQNMLSLGTPLDLYVYLSENGISHSFDESNLFWHVENIEYGDWHGGPLHDGSYVISKEIKTSKNLQNNGSLFAYIYFVPNGNSPNPIESNFDPRYTFHSKKRLNKFKKKVYQKTHNLLTGTTQDIEGKKKVDSGTKSEILSHWHPNLTINILVDNTSWVKGQIPHPINEFVVFDQFDPCHYQPVVYLNDFWNFASDYMPINDTTEYLNLTLTFAPISLFKWQLYVSQNVKNKWVTLLTEGVLKDTSAGTGGNHKDGGPPVEEDEDSQDENKDSFKRALLGTNPYLLGATILISIVHSVFEILAFKNDIQFWKSRQTLEGLSIRTIFYNIASSVIVLLYVMDNDTNFMVRITIFIGMLIEFWKITKCVDIKIDRSAPKMLGGLLPRINFKHKSTYVESNTREYDMMAYKYLSWVLFPLLVAYAGYAVIYQEHKGWYSFILSMLYGFLLTFGFIMMTPQLFINYKLKSVAHLPWRMMTYKALNTFIDDIFAFVIHMPTLYRIGCFRDDIIFFIYLYQRWIYKTDMKRVNEFGTSGELLANQNDKTAAIEESQTSKDGSPLAILPSAQEFLLNQADSQATTPNSENENGSSSASSEIGNGSETTSSFVKLNNSPEDVSGEEDNVLDEEIHSFPSAQPSPVESPNSLVKRKNVRRED